MSLNSFNTLQKLSVGSKQYHYHSLAETTLSDLGSVEKLPVSLKILLENLLRHEDGVSFKQDDIRSLARWTEHRSVEQQIAFQPARVLMQDFTGVPAIADLAAMRSAVVERGLDATLINPLSPVDLVIDHSVMVDVFGTDSAFEQNVNFELKRNDERYRFLRWGQQAFDNFQVVPPGTGICHQVNLEYLSKVVWTKNVDGHTFAYPDTLVGTDSHTTMVNGLGVLGWGVGGIEAEAAMLGQPISMLIPDVVGFKLTGRTTEGITATDLVLRIAQMLRKHGVVGKFVEFYGDGLDELPLADRATIGNMSPEFGATCAFFPVDATTLDYLKLTNRSSETVELVEAYAKTQGLWRTADLETIYSESMELDLATIVPSVAGPSRPQDRVAITDIGSAFDTLLISQGIEPSESERTPVADQSWSLGHGDVVIAAITSCTNTSNPSVMIGAGLLAKKAIEAGIAVKPWVKTSLAPGSKVVTEYLEKSGLQTDLDTLGFNLVGYGCTTCIGNSGPLPPEISAAITQNNLIVSAVLSGNRNFEGRIHQEVKANWLASPPLVVAYALAGTTRIDLSRDPLGQTPTGKDVYLRDIWPSDQEIADTAGIISSEMFQHQYQNVFSGNDSWRDLKAAEGTNYTWEESSYIKRPPFFDSSETTPPSVQVDNARLLAILGDSVTTDHISPAGQIQSDSPAGRYLKAQGIGQLDFNSYGSRRGNHEVMVRGTFANIRIRNAMVPKIEGGFTQHFPSGDIVSIYEASLRYRHDKVPLIIIAGKEYGSGSSRDWAAKGTLLLGVKAVIAESFERIHRSNLVGMGVAPLQFKDGDTVSSLELVGDEVLSLQLPVDASILSVGQEVVLSITYSNQVVEERSLVCRIDTENELKYFNSGGILPYVLNNLTKEQAGG